MASKLAKDIAARLNETKLPAIHKIDRLLNVAGPEFTEAILKETLKIEEEGGLMTEDGSRRRTVGGVFFYIAKGKLNLEQRREVFPFPKRLKRMIKAAKETPGKI